MKTAPFDRVRPRVYIQLQARKRSADGTWKSFPGSGACLTFKWDERRDGPIDVMALRDQIAFLLDTHGLSRRDCA